MTLPRFLCAIFTLAAIAFVVGAAFADDAMPRLLLLLAAIVNVVGSILAWRQLRSARGSRT